MFVCVCSTRERVSDLRLETVTTHIFTPENGCTVRSLKLAIIVSSIDFGVALISFGIFVVVFFQIVLKLVVVV